MDLPLALTQPLLAPAAESPFCSDSRRQTAARIPKGCTPLSPQHSKGPSEWRRRFRVVPWICRLLLLNRSSLPQQSHRFALTPAAKQQRVSQRGALHYLPSILKGPRSGGAGFEWFHGSAACSYSTAPRSRSRVTVLL